MLHSDVQVELRELWRRYREGDPTAEAECERRFGMLIRCIVRRVLRRAEASSALERFVLALAESEAQRIETDSSHEREDLATLVTRRICQAMVSRLEPSPEYETVRVPRLAATVIAT